VKAKIKPRIDLANRTRLETVIPLRTPYIINIDPCDTCNFQCKFCPTGDRALMRATPGRGRGPMDFDLYKNIIDGAREFEDRVKVIRLYKDGEPLLNKRFADMVAYAKQSGCCERVDTTTNAALLREELSLAMIGAGLDRINISVEGLSGAQYREFSRAEVDFDEYVRQIAFLYEHRGNCEMIVKINGDILTEEQKQEFYDTFGDIADGVFIESVMDCWPQFKQEKIAVNQARGIYGQQIREVLVCPYPFYSFGFNSDGTASLCFLDWQRKLLLGKAPEMTAREIWEGDALREYWRMFLRGERKAHPVCAACGQLRQGAPDDIDAHARELLAKV
jgi:MoaA/NifB/PqqE/SkfB family radical SAM enzyme